MPSTHCRCFKQGTCLRKQNRAKMFSHFVRSKAWHSIQTIVSLSQKMSLSKYSIQCNRSQFRFTFGLVQIKRTLDTDQSLLSTIFTIRNHTNVLLERLLCLFLDLPLNVHTTLNHTVCRSSLNKFSIKVISAEV